MPPAAYFRVCSRDLTWAGVFAKVLYHLHSLHPLYFLWDNVCFLPLFFFFFLNLV